jgi:hypothetical protein
MEIEGMLMTEEELRISASGKSPGHTAASARAKAIYHRGRGVFCACNFIPQLGTGVNIFFEDNGQIFTAALRTHLITAARAATLRAKSRGAGWLP